MLTKDDLQQIGKLIEPVKKQLDNVQRDTAHITTAIKVVATKQDVERVEAKQDETKEELKAEMQTGFQAIRGEFGKKIKDHEHRIEELEKDAGIPNPHKN